MRSKMFSIWGRKLLPLGIIIAVVFSLFVFSSSAAEGDSPYYYDASSNNLNGCYMITVAADGVILADGDYFPANTQMVTVTAYADEGYVSTVDSYSIENTIQYSDAYNISNAVISYPSSSVLICSFPFSQFQDWATTYNIYFVVNFMTGVPINWKLPVGSNLINSIKGLPAGVSSEQVYTLTFVPAPGYNLSDYELVTQNESNFTFDPSLTSDNFFVYSSSDPLSSPVSPAIKLKSSAVPSTSEGIIYSILNSIVEFLTGIGESFVDVFDNMILTDQGQLSPLAIWGLTFIGLGFSISVFYILIRRFS